MIYQIQVEEWERILASSPDEVQFEVSPLKVGDYVIFKLNGGEEIGKVVKILQSEEAITKILRRATQEDMNVYQEVVSQEQSAFNICKEKAREMNIPMKIASTHIQFDKSILRIDFIAEKKLLLKHLIKELTKVYPQRIEFRQIGARSYAKQFCAVGICGRQICCNTFLKEFEPITIDLVKIQNLSCGTAKLTGICGKLICCLAYEKESYIQGNDKIK